MSTSAAQKQTIERRTILGCAAHRSREQKLVERQFAVMPVTARDVELTFDIGGR
jgi:hypothetical protein